MTETCIQPNCSRPLFVKGMCRRHYSRAWRTGSPEGGRTEPGSILAWLERHRGHRASDCLIFPFSVNKSGYGQLQVNRTRLRAHRWMCEAVHGPAPGPNYDAAHDCGVRRCVNPAHLRWATRAENLADRDRHGTAQKGENASWSKLNEANVEEIRERLNRGEFQKAIAEDFGVDPSTVSAINCGRSWR